MNENIKLLFEKLGKDEAAVAKLMYLIGEGLPKARILEVMPKSIRGEMTV